MKVTKKYLQKVINEEADVVLNEFFKKWLRKRAEKAMVKKAQKSAGQHAAKIAAIKAEYEATGHMAAKQLLTKADGMPSAFVILQQPGKGMHSQYIHRATGRELTEIEFQELANQVAKHIVKREPAGALEKAGAGKLGSIDYLANRALRSL
jgi:hypothetical protein